MNENNLEIPGNLEATKLHANGIVSGMKPKVPEVNEASFNVGTHYKSGENGNIESNANLNNTQPSRLVNQGFGNAEMIGRFTSGDGMFDHGGSSNGDVAASSNIDGSLFFDDGDYPAATTGSAGAPELEF